MKSSAKSIFSIAATLAVTVAATAVATSLFTGSALAAVTVNYVKPDSFNDMPWSANDRAEVLKNITAHFTKLGAKLPADQDLKIDVTDIDLAGRIEPNAHYSRNDLRILRGGADWPSMRLHYVLESKGTVLRSGDEKLSDMTYLDHYNHYTSNEPLRYEKKMIESWFLKTIVPPAAVAAK